VRAGLLERAAIEIKVGSSEGATSPTRSHHPIRSGAVRAYKPTQHRHLAEVQMVLGENVPVDFAVTAIEMVRGVHLLAHVYLNAPLAEKDVWKLYRVAYKAEPFVRLVASKTACTASLNRKSSLERIPRYWLLNSMKMARISSSSPR